MQLRRHMRFARSTLFMGDGRSCVRQPSESNAWCRAPCDCVQVCDRFFNASVPRNLVSVTSPQRAGTLPLFTPLSEQTTSIDVWLENAVPCNDALWRRRQEATLH